MTRAPLPSSETRLGRSMNPESTKSGGASPTAITDDVVISRITTEIPDSPSASGEEWAISSLGALSDIEDEMSHSLQTTEPSLIMPRIMASSSSSNQSTSTWPNLTGATSSSGNSGGTTGPGKLRILMAGGSGIGKTSLIHAIVSESAFISSHSDPRAGAGSMIEVLANMAPAPAKAEKSARSAGRMNSLLAASTFRSASASASSSRTASPAPEEEYNLAFVDFPAPDSTTNSTTGLTDTEEYSSLLTGHLEAKYQETAALVNGFNPGTQYVLAHAASLRQFPLVDCCVYLFHPDHIPTSDDLDLLREVSTYTPIVPVIGHADTLSDTELAKQKRLVMDTLNLANVPTILLDSSAPHGVSTEFEHNLEMDASAVMAPDYRDRVLKSSELPVLVASMLSDSGARTLRASAARLFSVWVQSIHLQSALHNRLSRPLVVPARVELDLGWDLVPSSSAITRAASREALTERNGGLTRASGSHSALSVQVKGQVASRAPTTLRFDPPPCAQALVTLSEQKLSPINNIDPLDLNKWGSALYSTVAVILAVCGANMAAKYTNQLLAPSSPPPPPKLIDIFRGWVTWFRAAFVSPGY